jgi:hypothetical protein
VSRVKEGAVALVEVSAGEKHPEGTLLWLLPPEMWTAGETDLPVP